MASDRKPVIAEVEPFGGDIAEITSFNVDVIETEGRERHKDLRPYQFPIDMFIRVTERAQLALILCLVLLPFLASLAPDLVTDLFSALRRIL